MGPTEPSSLISSLIFLVFLFGIPFYGAVKGVKIYECFIEGAKEGFEVTVRIIPYLVAILVAVGLFRASGAMTFISGMTPDCLTRLGVTPEIISLILVRPLSGGASLGIVGEIIATHGADSYQAKLASVIMGSTETTFYVISVYFGAVAVSRVRYAVHAGLIADAAGAISAIIICAYFFK